jgi:dephospho-CoA kinase
MKVILLTGMPGSGKSAAIKIARDRDIPVHRMGDTIWAEIEARGLPLSKDNVGQVATEMRRTQGPDIWALRTIQMVKEHPPADLIIIDGCRSRAEVERFRAEFGDDMVIVAILASPRTRFERLKARDREDDIQTWDEFEERDRRELEWGLAEVIEAADITIENEGPVKVLHEKMASLLKH